MHRTSILRSLRVYDSLSRMKIPLSRDDSLNGALTWYSCGPTVYDVAHVGHARTYVTLDIARRTVEHLSGNLVHYAMGITDIDDKIVGRAREAGCTPPAIASRFEGEFLQDLRALGCLPPTTLLRVTEHIPEIISYISRVISQGGAYVVPPSPEDGPGTGSSVYLSIPALGAHYGKLAPTGVGGAGGDAAWEAAAGGVEAARARGKRDPRDFALWKGITPSPHPPPRAAVSEFISGGWAWDSPWGCGRPGWHIECTSMIHNLFGPRLDVHCGGVDLAFPHHCNEHAQADSWMGLGVGGTPSAEGGEGGREYKWVHAWLHTGHVFVNGAKMSKSLKNFTPIGAVLRGEGGVREALADAGFGTDPHSVSLAFRLWCLNHHYRDSLTFSSARLGDAGAQARKLADFLRSAEATRVAGAERGAVAAGSSLRHVAGEQKWTEEEKELFSAWNLAVGEVRGALQDDLDTPRALKALCDAAAKGGRYLGQGGGKTLLLSSMALQMRQWLGVFGLRGLGGEPPCRDQEGENCGQGLGGGEGGSGSSSRERAAVEALVSHRESLRTLAAQIRREIKKDGNSFVGVVGNSEKQQLFLSNSSTMLLQQCDKIRDVTLPELGWKLKDLPGGPLLTKN